MFADNVEIQVRAGKGGDGRLGFRREKYRALGGPDGGDGGHGGDVVLQVSHNLNTLAAFRHQTRVAAGDGQPGGSDRRHGKNGADAVVAVPVGTQVLADGQLLADLVHDGQRAVVAKGGRGGFGNAHFASSTRQAPRANELGEPGEEKRLTLELKLIADVGLVGLPNAGKSTLLSTISEAKPAIGDYPFTTLTPHLGVVDVQEDTLLVADIPGLIEGASKGRGLGDEFLRHIERTAVIVHLIDAYSENIAGDYATIQHELRSYAVDLTTKPQVIALTKVEGMEPAKVKAQVDAVRKVAGKTTVVTISAVAHQGLDELLRSLVPLVRAARAKAEAAAAESTTAIPVIDETSQPELWRVTKEGAAFVVAGSKLEGFARRTNWDNDASVERLRDILRKQGVVAELERQGADGEDTIRIAGHEFSLR